MTVFESFLLGLVQGVAEFLPISSSGHLALMQAILDFEKYNVNAVAFDLVLHLGTLVAVVIAFWKDVWMLIGGFFGWVKDGFKTKNRPERRLVVAALALLRLRAHRARHRLQWRRRHPPRHPRHSWGRCSGFVNFPRGKLTVILAQAIIWLILGKVAGAE